MKRRIYSFVLAIAMILGMCVMPAGAVEGPDLNLTLVTDTTAVEVSIEPLDLDETEYMAFESENYDAVSVQDDEQPLDTREVRDEVRIWQVTIRPLAMCYETGDVYVLEDIYKVQHWTTVRVGDASMRLTPSQVISFAEEALAALRQASNTSDFTWAICGWKVETIHDLIANQPLRIEWRPHDMTLDGTETRTATIRSSQQVKIGHYYGVPEELSTYYYAGISGAFYCRYASGSHKGEEYGLLMGGGVRMNSTN